MNVKPGAHPAPQNGEEFQSEAESSPAVGEQVGRKTQPFSLEILKPLYTTCSAFAWIIPAIMWGLGLFFICQALLIYQPPLPLSQAASPESVGIETQVVNAGAPAAQPNHIEINSVRYWLRLVVLVVLLLVWGFLAAWLYMFLDRRKHF
jgi:hypothetical protein